MMLYVIIFILMMIIFWCIFQIHRLTQTILQFQEELNHKEQQLIQVQASHQYELEHAIKDAQKRSNNTQRSVIKGQIAEQFVPFLADFPFYASECQFLGKPIDYVIFHNLDNYQDGLCALSEVQIIFADVKTGKARLNKRQEIIKQVILNGQVRFCELRVKEDNSIAVY